MQSKYIKITIDRKLMVCGREGRTVTLHYIYRLYESTKYLLETIRFNKGTSDE